MRGLLATTLILLVMATGCDGPFGIQHDAALQRALEEVRRSGDAVPLAQLTDVEWDTVHVFAEGASAEEVEEAVGVHVLRDEAFSTAGNLLVFTLDGQPQRASIIVPEMLVTTGQTSWPDTVVVQADPPGGPLVLSEG